MEKQKFDIMIQASPDKIWEVLWNDETYRKWTSVFSEGSHVKTDWNEGSKALFLDGKGQGMVSRIAEKRPNAFMSFEHLGIVDNDKEILEGPEVDGWKGAKENYALIPEGGKTRLLVETDVNEEYKEHFQDIFPKALQKVKRMAEEI